VRGSCTDYKGVLVWRGLADVAVGFQYDHYLSSWGSAHQLHVLETRRVLLMISAGASLIIVLLWVAQSYPSLDQKLNLQRKAWPACLVCKFLLIACTMQLAVRVYFLDGILSESQLARRSLECRAEIESG
jgi:hypothetical protein